MLSVAVKRINKGIKVTRSLPTTPLVTTADQKTFMPGLDFSTDDTFIDGLIQSATQEAQNYVDKAFISETIVAEWDVVGSSVPLPIVPLISITSVIAIEDNGTETTLTVNDDYFIRNEVIYVNTGVGLRITYVAGYGAASTDVPHPIIQAVKKMALDAYDNRDNQSQETFELLTNHARMLLNPYR